MRIRSAHTAAVFAGAALFCSAPVAVAQPTVGAAPQPTSMVSCASQGNVAFTPGVVPLPLPRNTNVQVTGASTSCAGTTPTGEQIVSATLKAGFDTPLSCFYGGTENKFSGTATLEWKTAEGKTLTSVLDLRISGQLLNTATIDGTVTSGLYLGEQIHGTFHLNLVKAGVNCASQSLIGGIRQSETDYSFTVAP